MKKSAVFLLLRVIAILVLARGVFSQLSGAADSVELFTGFSVALAGNASLEGLMRILSGITGLAAMTLLLMKKTKAISLGAFLGVALIVAALLASVVIPGPDRHAGTVSLAILVVGLTASFAVLFRFRGSFPVLGKFT